MGFLSDMLEEARLNWELGKTPEPPVPEIVSRLAPYIERLGEEIGPLDPMMGAVPLGLFVSGRSMAPALQRSILRGQTHPARLGAATEPQLLRSKSFGWYEPTENVLSYNRPDVTSHEWLHWLDRKVPGVAGLREAVWSKTPESLRKAFGSVWGQMTPAQEARETFATLLSADHLKRTAEAVKQATGEDIIGMISRSKGLRPEIEAAELYLQGSRNQIPLSRFLEIMR